MLFVLDQHTLAGFLMRANWESLWVDMSFQSDTLTWISANLFFLLLLSAACLAEKQQIPIL
jgi:hypothetical protein